MQRRLCFAALLLQQSRRRVGVGARPASSASAPLPAAKPPPSRRAFVDKARVQVIGGRGGKGVVSFEASSGDGWSKRPAGGTGGRGGSIVVRASASTQDLHMQTFVIRGRDGGDASGNKGSFGRDGKEKTIVVPIGTVVREVQRVYLVNAGDVDADVEEEDEVDEENDGGDEGKGEGGESEDWDERGVGVGAGASGSGGRPRGRVRRGSAGGATAHVRHPSPDTLPGPALAAEAGSVVSLPTPVAVDKLRSRRAALAALGGALSEGEGGGAARGDGALRTSSSGGGSGVVRVNKSGLAFRETSVVLADLSAPGQSLLVARGGAPGVGNRGSILTYSEQRQEELRPHISGGRGEVRFLELELKTIADVGLVGFPNAGKSSLLAAISKAHPVIADYPFTTLHPHVGVCAFADGSALKVADIPGLIEGAHEDRGLGHEFLRHIERTRVLCYVVDASAANADPAGDLASLQEELRLYDPRLPRRPALVVANKADLPGAAAGAARLRAATRMPVVEVSARLRRGAAKAVEALRWLADAAARAEAVAGARG